MGEGRCCSASCVGLPDSGVLRFGYRRRAMELEAEVKDLMQECALRQVGMASESSHMYIGMFFVVSYFRLSISGSSPIQACLHKMGLTLSDTALLASSA